MNYSENLIRCRGQTYQKPSDGGDKELTSPIPKRQWMKQRMAIIVDPKVTKAHLFFLTETRGNQNDSGMQCKVRGLSNT